MSEPGELGGHKTLALAGRPGGGRRHIIIYTHLSTMYLLTLIHSLSLSLSLPKNSALPIVGTT